MAQKLKSLFYKLILAGTVLLLMLLTAMGSMSVSSVALDQEVRCGMQEHSHTDACYLGDVLLCSQKAHIHSQNCYLVLLEDNNINWLLQTMEETDEKSLEGIIDSAMGQALVLNDSFAEETPPLELTQQDISSLNQTITDNQIEPAVVLNENLQAGTVISYVPEVKDPVYLSIGDTPTTNNRSANFYIKLDGKITFVSSTALSSSGSYYCSDTDAAAAYTDTVITNLTSSNLYGTYFLRYNIGGSAAASSDFTSVATRVSGRVRMGYGAGVRNVLMMKGQNAVEFYTVTLDYSRADAGRATQKVYVESGLSSGLALSEEFLWYDASGSLVETMPTAITATTTLYARPKAFDVTFTNQKGEQLSPPISGKPVDGSLAVTLPALSGEYEGWLWIKKDSDGTVWYASDGTAITLITNDTEFVAIPDTYTVTMINDTGQAVTYTIRYRESVDLETLPEGWLWIDEAGNQYIPGENISPVTKDMIFTATGKPIHIHYDVNFPSGAVNVVDSVPTIYGTTSATATEAAYSSRPATILDLTSRTARREISSSNKESVTYYFKGWVVEGSDMLIPPDVTLGLKELSNLADADDNIYLRGQWEEGNRYNSATFFVRFDSAAVDTNGNITSQPTENYTPEVFNTHVGGIDTSWTDSQIKSAYEIADTTSDNSYTADQNIRALYGERPTGMWLYDFPSDDYIFAYLKDYLAKNPGKQLTYAGEPVNPDELNHDYYAIRWYVCKLEGSSWHIDGKVYKKEGSVTIDKSFGGDDEALQAEKDGFYILAESGILNDDGSFTPYNPSSSHFKQYLLVVNQTGANNLRRQYPNATILIFDMETDSAHHYQWVIEGVELGEYWHIEEFPVEVPGYSCYAEYSVYDTDGEHSAIAEYGTRASVIGKTFALDEDPDQGLMVDFRNYYYRIETILIKKEDAKTGKPIGGAVFELWQNGNRLSFNYNEDTGQYERDQSGNGEFTQIVTSDDGFSIISTTGFSYDYGDVIVKEVLPPAGYDPAPDITVGTDENGKVIVKDVAGEPPDRWDEVAEVPTDDALVVKDHAAEFISVTVEKIWNTNTPADSVEVVLQANGQHAAALFPGMANAQVVLNGGNVWRYTWQDLPRYANGQIVKWGVKEVLIGGKPTLSDGITFANWTVTYSPGVGTDTDSDGDVDNWKFTVTNSTRRLQLILTKLGTDGALLPGSIFSLEQVELINGRWQSVANSSVNTKTTDANGMLTFDNLAADVYYRLTELQAAEGYFIAAPPVVLTMDGAGVIQRVLDDGTFAQIDDPLIQVTGPYNIRVTNIEMTRLPETGGVGTNVYMQTGVLLMIAATLLLLYKRKRRREGTDSS